MEEVYVEEVQFEAAQNPVPTLVTDPAGPGIVHTPLVLE